MNDPHETLNRIRAQAATASRANVPRLVDALEAALELHKPGRTFYGHGFSQQLCMCGKALPCPTVEVITDALEGGPR